MRIPILSFAFCILLLIPFGIAQAAEALNFRVYDVDARFVTGIPKGQVLSTLAYIAGRAGAELQISKDAAAFLTAGTDFEGLYQETDYKRLMLMIVRSFNAKYKKSGSRLTVNYRLDNKGVKRIWQIALEKK